MRAYQNLDINNQVGYDSYGRFLRIAEFATALVANVAKCLEQSLSSETRNYDIMNILIAGKRQATQRG